MDAYEAILRTLNVDAVQYGVKGMKWGVRRDRSGSSGPQPIVTRSKPGQKVKVAGGENRPAHEDAKRAAALGQKAKKSTTDSLSNEELNELLKRIDLEKRYVKLNPPKKNPAVVFATQLLKEIGDQEMKKLMRGDTTRIDQINTLLAGKPPGKHRSK